MKLQIIPMILLSALPATLLQAEEATLEEVMVTAEFRPVNLMDTAASITVFDDKAIKNRGAVHLEQLLNLAPNVNFASGASRGRYFQIRGIGERSQFVEPINPSVGLVIDGMDFTGIGGVATTLDLRQVEVLRGPQGTLFGANALAGMINLVSNGPDDELGGRAELILGNYDSWTLNAAIGGPATERIRYRLAAQVNRSDGWMNNRFLGRRTNDIDEGHARGRIAWSVSDRLDLDLIVMLSDVNNGYDAFSLDNTRDTYADQPGSDTLEVAAAALRGRWDLEDDYSFEALLSHVDADTVYSYDEDWSNPGICEGTPCDSSLWGFDWWYRSFDEYVRSNQNTSLDLRLLSGEVGRARWVGGLYFRDQEQTLERSYTYSAGEFESRYETENLAVYGQLELPFAERWTWVTGLRWEQRDWDYKDNSDGTDAADDEGFWGGRLALEYRGDSGMLIYGLVSRGFKPGGYNAALAARQAELPSTGPGLPPGAFVFDGETLVNLELGLKDQFFDGRLRLALSLFHQRRDDVQVKQSLVIPEDPTGDACPCLFVDSLQNASGGRNSGLEIEVDWAAGARVRLFGSLGLLHTEYRDFESFAHADADPENGIAYDLSGRDQAHAPRYQFTVGTELQLAPGWSLLLDVEAKDTFYTSANHNEEAAKFALFNLRLNWTLGPWGLSAWGRNLTDETVQTRGFGGFGNDPRKLYDVEPYFQLGEPRVYGISAYYSF